MLTAQLTGGLGNQLFTYARLALLARKNDEALNIDGSIAERVLGHTPDLFDFKLMDEKIISQGDYSKVGIHIERLLWRWEPVRRFSGRYQDSFLGNQGVLPAKVNGMKLRGFFQDYSVAQDFIETFTVEPLTLKSESTVLKGFLSEISGTSTLAIHMRRGDYLNYKDSFGVLSDEYYMDAVSEISKKIEFKKVLIFTDSPQLVKNFFAKTALPTDIVTSETLSTSENLILMSKCRGLVTSNSTYSFWAAMLSKDTEVITPAPWFKSNDAWLNSSRLNNPAWLTAKSQWMS